MATIVYIGRHVTGPEPDWGFIGYNQQRATVYGTTTQTLILYRLGGWLGKYAGSPVSRIGIGSVSGGAPGALLAYTQEFSPTVAYADSAGGASYEYPVTPIVLSPGQYSLVFTALNGQVSHSMRQAAFINESNENFYTKNTSGSSVPSNPIGGSPAYNGHMSLWGVAVVNTKPKVPLYREPSGLIVSTDTTPVFRSQFNDDEKVLPDGRNYDRANQVHIQVRQVGTTTNLWDVTYTATPAESSSHNLEREYAGSALSLGVDYEWRVRHSDQSSTWSDWSSWLGFKLSDGGAVALPTTPTGRQTTLTPGPYVAKWTNAGGASTTNVQIRLKINGALQAESPEIAKVVANGANISITNAEAGWGSMGWGTNYTFEIRGKSGGVWSQWSEGQSFSTNYAPGVPTAVSPGSGEVVTSLPLLRVKVTDPDNSSVTAYFRIKNNSGALLFTRTGTYHSLSDEYRYQTTPSDMASFAVYQWDSYSFDGTLYSGTQTLAANAVASAERTVNYAQGPTVTVSSPADAGTVTSSNLTVTWTGANQTKYRITITDVSGNPIYDTGTVTSAVQTLVISPGLQNGQSYSLKVEVTNNLGLLGVSSPVVFLVSYPPISVLPNVNAYPVTLGMDTSESAVVVEWGPTTYPLSQFVSYSVYRSPLGADAGQAIRLARIPNPMQTVFLDATGASGQTYLYAIAQEISVGVDVLSSDRVGVEAGVKFEGVMLNSIFHPESYHTQLLYPAKKGDEGTLTYQQDKVFVIPTGAKKATVVRGAQSQWNPSGDYRLVSDHSAPYERREAELKALAEEAGHLCWRSGRGEVLFVSLASLRVGMRRRSSEVNLQFEEVEFELGAEE